MRSSSPNTPFTTVFMDRDGVINLKMREHDYVTSWERFAFIPGAPEAICLLNQAGIGVVVVTNQRGVARGLMLAETLHEIHDRMCRSLAEMGSRIDAVYACTHDHGECDCRKPALGLFLQAQHDLPEIDFSRSLIIGDSLGDMLPCAQLGCAGILIADEERASEILPALEESGIHLCGVCESLFDAVTRFVLPAES